MNQQPSTQIKKADHLIGFFDDDVSKYRLQTDIDEITQYQSNREKRPSKPKPVLIAFVPTFDALSTKVGVKTKPSLASKLFTVRAVVVDAGVDLHNTYWPLDKKGVPEGKVPSPLNMLRVTVLPDPDTEVTPSTPRLATVVVLDAKFAVALASATREAAPVQLAFAKSIFDKRA